MKHIGIFFTDKNIRLAGMIDKEGGEPVYEETSAELPASSAARAEVLSDMLKGFGQAPLFLSLALSRDTVYVRFITFPSCDPKEIKTMALYDLPNLLPVNPEELLADTCLLEAQPNGYGRAMLVAGHKKKIEQDLADLIIAGFIPDSCTVSTVPLCADLTANKMMPELFLSLHCEDGRIEFSALHKGLSVFSRGVPPAQDDILGAALTETKKTLDSLSLQGLEIKDILISGRGIDLAAWKEKFEHDLGISVCTDAGISVAGALVRRSLSGKLCGELLPSHYTRQKRSAAKKRNLILTAVLVMTNIAFLANIFTLKIRQRQAFLPALQAEIAKVERPAMALQDKMRKVKVLGRYFYTGRYTLGLMSELYRLAPEGMEFRALEISGRPSSGSLMINGQADQADDVLTFSARLKQSSLISGGQVGAEYEKAGTPGQARVDFIIKAKF